MIPDTDKSRFAALLARLGIPADQITVFGASRINVHVTCKSRTTADKWAMALATIEPGREISCVRHMIERKKFKPDARNQSHVNGWLVAL